MIKLKTKNDWETHYLSSKWKKNIIQFQICITLFLQAHIVYGTLDVDYATSNHFEWLKIGNITSNKQEYHNQCFHNWPGDQTGFAAIKPVLLLVSGSTGQIGLTSDLTDIIKIN